MIEIEHKLKMRELGIFKNKILLKDDNGSKLMLHHDDMTTYNSWFLTEHHGIDKIVYRGEPGKLPVDVIANYKINKDLFTESLGKIGNPKNIIITLSDKDTY